MQRGQAVGGAGIGVSRLGSGGLVEVGVERERSIFLLTDFYRLKSKLRSDLPIFCRYTASNFSFMETVKMSFHKPTRPANAQRQDGRVKGVSYLKMTRSVIFPQTGKEQ